MATDVDTNALNEFANGSSGFITGGITGLIIGTVIGFIAKDKLFNNKTDLVKKQRELDAIYANHTMKIGMILKMSWINSNEK